MLESGDLLGSRVTGQRLGPGLTRSWVKTLEKKFKTFEPVQSLLVHAILCRNIGGSTGSLLQRQTNSAFGLLCHKCCRLTFVEQEINLLVAGTGVKE